MGKRTIFAVVVVMLSFGLFAAYAIGEKKKDIESPKADLPQAIAPEAKPEEKETAEAKPKEKEATKDQMLAELKEDFSDNDELFDVIQGLKASTGKDGNAVYTYNNTALDELSKEDLANLYNMARRALVKIRTDRIQRQLEISRQAERLQRTANPPQPPRIPAAVPSPPRTPPQPPPVPQRR